MNLLGEETGRMGGVMNEIFWEGAAVVGETGTMNGVMDGILRE